jgi:threonylcarbamoyladenosine tRNA methylthiotransferase MtaB
MLKVAFRSLGCKLNQLETESVADAFRSSGALVLESEEGADLVVVNTCTVTSKAEQKARHIARAALAASPGAAVLLTGCYAQMDREGLESLHERVFVVPGDDKDALLSLGGWLGDNWQGHGDLASVLMEWRAGLGGRSPDRFAFRPEHFAFHSRPALKIQDGCDNRCAYCRVCLARGPATSLAADEVLARARELEAAGKAEIVLTGVNLSQYRSGSLRFPSLLHLLLSGTSRISFRLSSFEPDGVDTEFLEAFAHPRVRPHVHLPIQSGADPVLARMARPYRRDRVLAVVEALRRAKGDPFIACDLITGFPGETEADFAATLELVRDCGFAWIHAFPFSPRPGTKAYGMRPRVPERIAGERVEALTALARAGKAAYAARWIGSEVEVVLEEAGSVRRGTSSNYLKLRIEGRPEDAPEATSPSPGDALRCILTAALENGPEDAAARRISKISLEKL